MTSTVASRKQSTKACIYHGTFIHCETSTALSVRHGYLWVDTAGKIGGFCDESEVTGHAGLLEKLGWSGKELSVIESGKNGFFFPGFIGTFILIKFLSSVMPPFAEHSIRQPQPTLYTGSVCCNGFVCFNGEDGWL